MLSMDVKSLAYSLLKRVFNLRDFIGPGTWLPKRVVVRDSLLRGLRS